jgi:hypothetical protein
VKKLPKKIFLLSITAFLCLIKVSYCQDIKLPIDTSTHKVSYSVITTTAAIKQKELHSKAKQWVVFYFKSAKDVIQMDDADNGKLIIKGVTGGYHTTFRNSVYAENLYYVIIISTKDGKYKINITDLEQETLSDGRALYRIPVERTLNHIESDKSEINKEETEKIYNDLKSNINAIALNIIADFKSFMSKKEDF